MKEAGQVVGGECLRSVPTASRIQTAASWTFGGKWWVIVTIGAPADHLGAKAGQRTAFGTLFRRTYDSSSGVDLLWNIHTTITCVVVQCMSVDNPALIADSSVVTYWMERGGTLGVAVDLHCS